MKGRALFRRAALALVPASKEAREIFAAIKEGATVFVEIWSPRNMAQHKKYFAILRNVVEATGKWTSQEHLRKDVLLALHRYDEHVSELTGEVVKAFQISADELDLLNALGVGETIASAAAEQQRKLCLERSARSRSISGETSGSTRARAGTMKSSATIPPSDASAAAARAQQMFRPQAQN